MINIFWIFKIYSYLGKPLLRAKGDELIGNIKELIKNQDKLGYQIIPISQPEYKLSNVRFREPMKLSKILNYKLDDQVNRSHLSYLVF
jgi:hypothetical protein